MSIGQSLEQTRKDLRLMPTPTLVQYKQNPGKQAVDGMPMDMLAGLELSRRAQLQQEQLAKNAPNPQQMPTLIDAAAMGLAGMAPQGAPQAAPPGAPQAAPPGAPPPPQAMPQGALQGMPPQGMPPQQMAQAPQPPAPPQQPTQQQSQRLATGGLASLGGMSRRPGEPVQMMARGGIVAFRDNPDQPVDANMPSGEESTSTAGNFFRGIKDFVKRQQAESQATQQRNLDANEVKREIKQTRPGLFEQLTPTQRAGREQEVNTLEETLQGYRNMGKAPEAAPAPTAAAGPLKVVDVPDQGRGQLDLAALLKQTSGGGGGNANLADLRRELAEARKPTEEETNYRNLTREQMEAIRNRPSPEVSEADRKRILGEQFAQSQATSKPYYDKMQQMIDEERAATKARYADKNADALIRGGLKGLSSRKPGFGGFFEGANESLDYLDKAGELEAAANQAARRAQMDLTKSQMSDEKGDRDSAQRYFDSYQKNKRDAEAYEIQRSNLLISAQKGIVDTEGKRERSATAMQLGVERLGSQMENNSLRNQLNLAKLMAATDAKNQPKQLTISEKLALDKRANEIFSNPMSPEYQQYIGAAPNGKQLLADLQNKRIKPDDPKLQDIVSRAKRQYVQNLVGGTRSSAGNTIPTMDSLEQQ